MYLHSLFHPYFTSRRFAKFTNDCAPRTFKNINQTPNKYTVSISAVGRNIDDVDVNVQEGDLIITLNKPQLNLPEDAINIWQEIAINKKTFKFTIPSDVDLDNIRAELKDGLLTVELPKATPLQRSIPVQVAG